MGGRNIIIVEGVYSRLGVDNDLFDNALSIRRIICPAKNAYESYFKIFNSIINNHKENDLILLSLGPTATILAYEIGNIGIQCIDIGHVDIEYEWFLKKAKIKVPVQGKFVNEARTYKPIADIIDENYKKQIIDIILEN